MRTRRLEATFSGVSLFLYVRNFSRLSWQLNGGGLVVTLLLSGIDASGSVGLPLD